MLEKQLIPLDYLETLRPLPFELPEFEGSSSPFSHGARPEEYSPEGLKKVSQHSTARTDAFRKYVLAIESVLEGPVPYSFRTRDGTVRSLDAGCLGFCVNRSEPYFDVTINDRGFIGNVSSTAACDHFRVLVPKLVAEISGK